MNQDPATRFLESLSNLDAEEVSGQLCDDARLSIRSGLFAAGKPRIKKALKRGISSLNSIRCVPAAVWMKDNVGVIEADVTCERLDGSSTLFPVTLILRFRNQLIEDIRLYTYEPAALSNFLQ